MRSDSPSPNWYEPPDLHDDDTESVPPSDDLSVHGGVCAWAWLTVDDAEDDWRD